MSMIKILMLSTLSSLVVISAAMADGTVAPTGDDGHDKRVTVRCEFQGPKGTECRAFASFRERKDDQHSTLDMDGRDRARLSVSCGGVDVYNDGARVDDRDDVVIVKAFQGIPALAYENERDNHDGDGRDVRAWLNLGDDSRLMGRCEVRRDSDDDNHGGGI